MRIDTKVMGAMALALCAGLAACDVEQEQPGELPDVEVEEGQMPEYDVETGDVELEADTETVVVPEMDVEMPGDTTP